MFYLLWITTALAVVTSSLPQVRLVPQLGSAGEVRVGDGVSLSLQSMTSEKIETVSRLATLEGKPPSISMGWSLQLGKEGQSILAYPLKAGNLKLPSLRLMNQSGEIFAQTVPLNLNVKSVLSPKEPPNFQSPLIGVKRLEYPWWLMVLIGLFALALLSGALFLLFRYSRRERIEEQVKVETPRLPEHEEALKALKELEIRRLWETSEFKGLYFGVSEILKQYLGRRYRVDALESTSDELIKRLEGARIDSLIIREVRRFLEQMDVVKFTDEAPELSAAQSLVPKVVEFVEETKSVTSVSPPVGGQPK